MKSQYRGKWLISAMESRDTGQPGYMVHYTLQTRFANHPRVIRGNVWQQPQRKTLSTA